MSTRMTMPRLLVAACLAACALWGCGGGGTAPSGGGSGGGGGPVADTSAPSTVTGLAATATSTTQINLTWSAATDNVGVTSYRVERCSGAACASFTQVATPATTSYSDTGLTASTAYSYRVKAVDAAGNASASFSTEASATTQAPPATGSLTGTVVSLKTGLPVAGAQVSVGSRITTSAADGLFTLTQVPTGNKVLVHVDPPAAAFAETFRLARVTANATTDLSRLAVVPTGTTVAVNVATGATINAGTVGRVVIPPNALVPKTGGAAATTVNVSVTPISAVDDPQSLPGEYTVAVSGGVMQPFRSYGALLVDLRDANGAHYTLAPGTTATIRIPASTLHSTPYPATLALLSFNESTGTWVEEPGVMTLNAGGTYYEGTVSHFTYFQSVKVAGCPGGNVPSGCGIDRIRTVDGRMVTENDIPLANVRVFFLGVNYSGYSDIYTDSTGTFSFKMETGDVSVLWGVAPNGRTGTYEADGRSVGPDIHLGDIRVVTAPDNLRLTAVWNRTDTLSVRSIMTVPTGGPDGGIGGPDDAGAFNTEPFGGLQRNDALQYHAITLQRLYVGRYRYFIEQTTGGSMNNAQMRVYIESSRSPSFLVLGPPQLEPYGSTWHSFDAVVAPDCSVQIYFVNEFVASGSLPAAPPDAVGTGQMCTPP